MNNGTNGGVKASGTSGVGFVDKNGGTSDAATVPKHRRRSLNNALLFATFLLAAVAVALSIAALIESRKNDDNDNFKVDSVARRVLGLFHPNRPVSRIAVGSCTSYYYHPQHIWTKGVIPAKPDAWIWMGDLVYMDSAIVNCRDFTESPQCNCDVTLERHPPYDCNIANLTHARDRVRSQLLDYDYQQFLKYMCPDFEDSSEVVPHGAACPRPILGTYDDHDFGKNNGNRNLANKHEFKNLFLDAIGEPQSSPRRNSANGIEFKYTFNADGPKNRKIDVFVLDERYERDSLPCGIRREWCEDVLKAEPEEPDHDYIWCQDFLQTGGPLGVGSCCHADDEWAYGWCEENEDSKDPLWDIACDPSSPRFGSVKLEVDKDTNTLVQEQSFDNLTSMTYSSNFCDVLGPKQRSWLQKELTKSTAPLKFVVSGSVPFSNPTNKNTEGYCSGDDFNCYGVAQKNFGHIIGSVKQGCVILLTGDYHISDLVVLEPGNDTLYSQYYPTGSFVKTIPQLMSSGLTETTARTKPVLESCRDWSYDTLGMRPLGNCSFVANPSFGIIDIDWKTRRVSLQHRSAEDGSIATAIDDTKQEIVIDIATCAMVA